MGSQLWSRDRNDQVDRSPDRKVHYWPPIHMAAWKICKIENFRKLAARSTTLRRRRSRWQIRWQWIDYGGLGRRVQSQAQGPVPGCEKINGIRRKEHDHRN